MAAFVRCDTCRAEIPGPQKEEDWPPDWLGVARMDTSVSHTRAHEYFCSWRCLAEYATARAMIDSATDE